MCPHTAASLRRIRGRDLPDPTTSLVLQTRGEQTRSASADAPVQAALLRHPLSGPLDGTPRTAGHRAYVKGFDADRAAALRNVRGGLFGPALRRSASRAFSFAMASFVQPDRWSRVRRARGAAAGPSTASIHRRRTPGHAAVHRSTTPPTPHPTLDTHHAAITRTCHRLRDVGERDMPASGPITGDPVGLHTLRDRPRQEKAHPARPSAPTPVGTGGSDARYVAI